MAVANHTSSSSLNSFRIHVGRLSRGNCRLAIASASWLIFALMQNFQVGFRQALRQNSGKSQKHL